MNTTLLDNSQPSFKLSIVSNEALTQNFSAPLETDVRHGHGQPPSPASGTEDTLLNCFQLLSFIQKFLHLKLFAYSSFSLIPK